MGTEPGELTHAKVVEIAHGMIDGRIGIIDGARRLNDLRRCLGIDHLDDTFVRFVAIDSETDTLPIGDTRKLWAESALVEKDRQVARAESHYREWALEGCRQLIDRFRGASNTCVQTDRATRGR